MSCAPKTEQDLHLPIAKVSTSSNAHAVVRLFTSGKPLDPYAKDARNTKKRLKKAIGPTQESPLIKNIAKSRLTVLATFSGKNKKRLAYDVKVCETLEIRRHNCGPGSGLNEDMGAYVKTSQWDPVFHKMAVT